MAIVAELPELRELVVGCLRKGEILWELGGQTRLEEARGSL